MACLLALDDLGPCPPPLFHLLHPSPLHFIMVSTLSWSGYQPTARSYPRYTRRQS